MVRIENIVRLTGQYDNDLFVQFMKRMNMGLQMNGFRLTGYTQRIAMKRIKKR